MEKNGGHFSWKPLGSKITSQFCSADLIELATPSLAFWKEMTARLIKKH